MNRANHKSRIFREVNKEQENKQSNTGIIDTENNTSNAF